MASQELCGDVIFEILSRSSPETIARCRLLNRECNERTYDSAFLDLHSRRTGTLSGFFVSKVRYGWDPYSFVSLQTESDPRSSSSSPSLDFLLRGYFRKIEACSASNGIMLCVVRLDKGVESCVVCKPATKQWCYIPRPKLRRYVTEGTGIAVTHLNPLRYKIVRISSLNRWRPRKLRPQRREKLDDFESFMCEIFDSEAWEWKRSWPEELRLPRNVLLHRNYPAVSACGALHWLTSCNGLVIAFDVNAETFSAFPLPDEIPHDERYVKLVNYTGKLGFVRMNWECLSDFWVLENYAERSWVKLVRDAGLHTLERGRPVSFYGKDVIVSRDWNELVYHNFERGRLVGSLRVDYEIDQVFPFFSDFKRVNLMGKRFGRVSRRIQSSVGEKTKAFDEAAGNVRASVILNSSGIVHRVYVVLTFLFLLFLLYVYNRRM